MWRLTAIIGIVSLVSFSAAIAPKYSCEMAQKDILNMKQADIDSLNI